MWPARSEKTHYNEMNVLSMHALLGAYTPEGRAWVDELCAVLTEQRRLRLPATLPSISRVCAWPSPKGTYLLFLDCTDWCAAHGKTIDEVEQAGWDVGVAWQDGRMFHGPCAIRVNLALPKSLVVEAFERLDKYVFNA